MTNPNDFNLSELNSKVQRDDMYGVVANVAEGLVFYADVLLRKAMDSVDPADEENPGPAVTPEEAKTFSDIALGVSQAIAVFNALNHRCGE